MTGSLAQDGDRSDWLRNPAMGSYKACAELMGSSGRHAEAQYALAVTLRTGRGRERDLAESARRLRRAADRQHAAAVSAPASGGASR